MFLSSLSKSCPWWKSPRVCSLRKMLPRWMAEQSMKTEDLIKLLDDELLNQTADVWRALRLAKYALQETLDKTPLSKSPLTQDDLMKMAVIGAPIPPLRALATYADEKNWVQLYGPLVAAGDYQPKACEWIFIGPVRPGYELAQNAIGREMPNSAIAQSSAIKPL